MGAALTEAFPPFVGARSETLGGERTAEHAVARTKESRSGFGDEA
jgi:hypothetical protein